MTVLAVPPGFAAPARRASEAPQRPVAADPASRPGKARPFTVAVLGDGFAEALAEGLRLTYAGQPDVTILEKTHAPFGLNQMERFEWPIAVRNIFASGAKIDAAVILLGANDTMPLRDGTATADPGSPRWRELYGARVEAVATLFRDKAVPLIWVGLPVVQDPKLSADFVALNEIVRDRAVKAGATYVDSWDAFADENGKYSGSGPDVNGRNAKLRTADGIDFTQAGERKLASFVEADLRQDREKAAAPPPAVEEAVVVSQQPGFDKALDIDVNAQIRRELGLPALPQDRAKADEPARVGPVIAITAPVLSPDGQLAAGPIETAGTDGANASSAVRRALVEGQPLQPRLGRTDDFTWPRP